MRIAPFQTEKFFELYELSATHMLSASDCESISARELAELGSTTLEEILSAKLCYGPMNGTEELRMAVASQYQNADAEQILVVNAPEEGIFLTMHALLEKGDRVICQTPCYDSLRNVAEYLGCEVVPWQLHATEKSWRWDLSELKEKIVDAKMVVVNLPHNPTGFVPTSTDLDQLLKIVDDAGATLFCDEMYRGLEMPGVPRLPSAAGGKNTVVLSGLSKAHGLPGLRCGWLAISNATQRKAISDWKNYTTICAPNPVEALGCIAVTHQETLFSRHNKRIAENNELATKAFERLGYNYRQPSGGSIALVETNFPETEELCHSLAKEHGIVLLPGNCLGAPERFFRVGLGRKGFGDGLAALEKVMSAISYQT